MAHLARQRIFDIAAAHMIRQGRRAAAADGGGLYYAADGTKCAIGSLIPDALYSPAMEGLAWNAHPVREALQNAGVDTGNRAIGNLLGHLQAAHDGSIYFCNEGQWRKDIADRLREIARVRRLDPRVIDNTVLECSPRNERMRKEGYAAAHTGQDLGNCPRNPVDGIPWTTGYVAGKLEQTRLGKALFAPAGGIAVEQGPPEPSGSQPARGHRRLRGVLAVAAILLVALI